MPDYNTLGAMCPTLTADSGAQVNAAAIATIAAPQAGQSIYVYGVCCSASGQPAAPVAATLLDSASASRGTFLLPAAATAPVLCNFPRPLQIAAGRGVTLTLPALGGGISGAVQIHYRVGGA